MMRDRVDLGMKLCPSPQVSATTPRAGRRAHALRVAVLTLSSALLLAACGVAPQGVQGSVDTTPETGTGELTIAFQMAGTESANETQAAPQNATPGTRIITGSNGTLALTTLAFVVEELEFDCQDGRNSCVDFTSPATFLHLPFDGRSVEATRQAIPDGIYDELDFEIDVLDPEDEPLSIREQRLALLTEIRASYPSFPVRASMVTRGTFTPTGGVPIAFETFLAADVEIEMALVPSLTVQGGVPSRAVTVEVDPAGWFVAPDGRVLDLSAHDFATTGNVIRLDQEIRSGFTDVRDGDDGWDDDDPREEDPRGDDRSDDDMDDDRDDVGDRDDDDTAPPSWATAPVSIALALDPTLETSLRSLRLEASNGVLDIATLAFLVTEFELDCRDDRGSTAVCFEFSTPAMFTNLPLDGDPVRIIEDAVPVGQYDEVEFDIDAFEDDPEWPTTQTHLDALFSQVRSQYPDFPIQASMVISGTFTPSGSDTGVPFRTYLDADEDVELLVNPILDVIVDGADQGMTIYVNPTSWLTRVDGTLIDLSQHDYATTGRVYDLSTLRGGFRVADAP